MSASRMEKSAWRRILHLCYWAILPRRQFEEPTRPVQKSSDAVLAGVAQRLVSNTGCALEATWSEKDQRWAVEMPLRREQTLVDAYALTQVGEDTVGEYWILPADVQPPPDVQARYRAAEDNANRDDNQRRRESLARIAKIPTSPSNVYTGACSRHPCTLLNASWSRSQPTVITQAAATTPMSVPTDPLQEGTTPSTSVHNQHFGYHRPQTSRIVPQQEVPDYQSSKLTLSVARTGTVASTASNVMRPTVSFILCITASWFCKRHQIGRRPD